ncbi:hypothetical protein M0R04_14995 [Candidatus Dojkabacteria bacterium]|jgi:hypothetical protein|nr:hypothetical protein [Candidatus Dojkabacteria bacterium]
MNYIQPPSITTEDSITVFLNGKPYSADISHPNFDKIIEVFNNEFYDQLPDLFNLVESVKIYADTNPDVVIDEVLGTVLFKGSQVDNSMVNRILTMMGEGFDITPMTNLLANLYSNVSKKAIDELYDFLEFGKLPITPDGHFLAYKRVNENYTSCHDGRTDNSIGNVVSMERRDVDDRSEVTCSYGLHICSFDYLAHYSGAKVIVVKVNPADVVSIPTDYDNTKARVCRYEVIGELTPEEAGLNKHSFGPSVWDDTKSQDDVDEWDSPEDALDEEFIDCLGDDYDYEGESKYDSLENYGYLETSNNLLNADNTKPWVHGDLDDSDFSGAEDESLTADDMTPEELFPYEIAMNSTNTSYIQLVTGELETDQQTSSRWYKVGYTNGFSDGLKKLSKADPKNYADYDLSATEQDVADWNAAYAAGYSDGKCHRTRQYPRTYWFD